MWIVTGLGNPGPKYDGTRHNIGFMVVDALAARGRAGSFQTKFKGEAVTSRVGSESVLLLKPSTYMNLSGDSVGPAMQFYKVGLENLIVIHDDLDLDLGQIKLKKGGGHGGHNGIRHISGRLGPDFVRVRAGIGRPKHKGAVSSFVLTSFSGEEQEMADLLIQKVADAVEVVISEGLLAAQNRFHEKKAKKPKANREKQPPDDTAAAGEEQA